MTHIYTHTDTKLARNIGEKMRLYFDIQPVGITIFFWSNGKKSFV